MDKAFYDAEIEALRRQLVNVQKVAIERGETIIEGQEQVMQLKLQLAELRANPLVHRYGQSGRQTAEVAADSKEYEMERAARAYKAFNGLHRGKG